MKRHILYLHFLFTSFFSYSQNEASKWYFGNQAGIDFMSNPPAVLTNGAINTAEGCSSIANSSGQLLFYTDGITIWNSSHTAMANGTGLLGNGSTTQSGVIVKQPGSQTIYYVFSQDDVGGPDGLRYTVVDMSLSAGQGSVTAKNIMLHNPSCEKITSVKHCNGVDVWLITHDVGSNVFRNFLITSAGINTTAVTSNVGLTNSSFVGTLGQVKASPNGKKLGVALYGDNAFEVFDFDPSTGIVSNGITLLSGTQAANAYGCEFSPDGTKFYGVRYGASYQICQWDLCAGSSSAIIASSYTFAGNPGINGSMQLAVDGKIYISKAGQSYLGVINNPNAAGAACNFVNNGMNIFPKTCNLGLPNFITSWFKQTPPYTYTLTCQTASFTAPMVQNNMTLTACSALGFSLNGMQWNFGDPLSGSANTSTLQNPTHSYAALGTYTVSLILYYSCGGGTDTIKQVLNVNQPCISVTSTSITCASLGSATVQATGGIGPFSYTWMPGNQTSSVATGLSPGIYSIAVHDQAVNFSYTATTVFNSLIPLSGNVAHSTSLTCHGAATGTAEVQNISRGSGSHSYAWYNGTVTYTNANPQNLSAGIWSITVTDSLTGCTIKQSLLITQPNPATVVIVASSPTACVNTPVTMIGNTNGGQSPFTYSWTNGPPLSFFTVNESVSGSHQYSLTSIDDNGCAASNTVIVDYLDPPSITVTNASVCPGQTATITAGGASSYTWNNMFNGPVFTDAPLTTSIYTVTGTALGCSSSHTAYIFMFNSPLPLISSNSPLCEGEDLQLAASGGTGYSWSGPASFFSAQSLPVLSNVSPLHSGTYSVNVTSAEGCTATASQSVLVHPSPTLSAAGTTVCTTQTISLTGVAAPGSAFHWFGPSGFQSANQFVQIAPITPSNAGNYTLLVTSAESCTAAAVAHVSVTVNPTPQILSNDPQCAGSDIQLSGTGQGNYNWSGPNGFGSNSASPLLSNVQATASGIYTLNVTSGPCQASVSKSITVFALPSVTAGANSPVCETSDLHLLSNAGAGITKFQWSGPSFNAQGATAVRLNSNLSFTGIYTLTVTDLNNCTASDEVTVTVGENPKLTATGATVCLYQPATLLASGASSYRWEGPYFFQSALPGALISNVNLLTQGIYTVTGKAANSCTSVTTVSVGYMSLPSPAIKSSASALCLNEELYLSGTGAETLEWFGPAGNYASGPSFFLKMDVPALAGTYTLKATDAFGCSATVTENIKIHPLPYGSLSGTEKAHCVPFCNDYRFYPAGPQPQKIRATWQLDQRIYSGHHFRGCFTEPGVHAIKAFVFDSLTGCSDNIVFEVKGLAVPEADYSYEPLAPVQNGEPVQFSNQSRGGQQQSWDWFIADKWSSRMDGERPSHYFETPGTYPVAMIVRNTAGCSDTIVKEIKVREAHTLFVPNAFTPNGDDDNENFRAVGTGIRRFHLRVYDRWGEVVFETTDMLHGWDGSFRSQNCKEDVYNWRIDYTTTSGETKMLTGHVTLYR